MIELKTQLFDYQKKAVEKLSKVKVGALYMEMGTGKTRTALELIKHRMSKGKVNHILWLCPCTVKADLRRNLQQHAIISDDILTICGIETLSSSIKSFYKLMDLVMAKECYLIVDESNLVKNPFAIRSRNILRLAEECKYKLILNGTPITKNVADLFAQWQILDWRILGYRSFYSFAANHLEYDKKYKKMVRNVLDLDYLMDKISPYTYQIRKDECLSLPSKMCDTYFFTLTEDQYTHYRHVVDDFLSEKILEQMQNTDLEFDTLIYRTFNALQEVTSGQRITTPAYLHTQHENFFKIIEDNPRIKALEEIVKWFNDEKIIIWCKYKHEIDDIYNILSNKNYKCCKYYGKLSFKKREESIRLFKNDYQILIANNACGSYGLNLQFCHNMIYYNNDWNWATRAQSEDRVHRIGQDSKISIVSICAEFTIDERILECLQRKENLSDSFKNHLKEQQKALSWLMGKGAQI